MADSPRDSSVPDSPAEPGSTGDSEAWGWTRTHRIGIAAMLAITLVFLLISYARNPYRLDDPIVLEHGAALVLEQRLDPNTADAPSLSRLPHIGEALADRLVAYRQENVKAAPDGIVFHSLDDLTNVGGFGPKTRESLRPYLKFPPAPATATTSQR